MKSDGYGYDENWGFRAAVTHPGGKASAELKLDLGDGVIRSSFTSTPASS